jgi:hypothetical protein
MKYGKTVGNKREVVIGTAHTVTVNSPNETINQSTNRLRVELRKTVGKRSRDVPYLLRLGGVGFEKGCKDGTAIRWPEREMEAGYEGSESYYSVSRKDRQVDLSARG